MAYNPQFSRDRRGKWPAEQNAGITQVVVGSDAYIMEDEFNLLQWIQNEARADLVRAQSHSGVVDFNGVQTGLADGSAQRFGGVYGGTGQGLTNTIEIDRFTSIMNGYKVDVRNFVNNGGTATFNNLVLMPTGPTIGKRDDLVFLEAWFQEVSSSSGQADTNLYEYGGVNSGTVTNDILDPRVGAETTRRMQLRWRIRTVAGVDFTKYPELGITTNTWNVLPYSSMHDVPTGQGGSTSPVVVNVDNDVAVYGFYRAGLSGDTQGRSSILDNGLYISGNGTPSSQQTLNTADGYVYAIPLFHVKRLNNAGYREDNLDGARDYYAITQAFTFSPTLNYGQTQSVTVGATDYNNMQIGDIIRDSGAVSNQLKVVAKNGSNSVTFLNMAPSQVSFSGVGTTWGLNSDRPDGKYSNIIDADDIIDLRHRVFNPVNYELEMQKAFDQLLRGQLRTIDTQKMAKNRYGLRKAPLGLAQELSPFTFVGDDGISRDLVNLLGSDGDFENDSDSNGVGDGWSKTGAGTFSLDTSSHKYGSKSQKISASTGNNYISRSVTYGSNAYYLVLADVFTTGTTAKTYMDYNGGNSPTVSYPIASNEWSTLFQKVQGDGGVHTLLINIVDSGVLNIDGVRVYEIDQATYNKIGDGTTTGFQTGSDLAKKFPYVSSYPSLVENLTKPFTDPSWAISAQGKVNNANSLTVTATASYQSSTLSIPVVGGQSMQVRASIDNLSTGGGSTGGYINLAEYDSSNNLVANTDIFGSNVTGGFKWTLNSATVTLKVAPTNINAVTYTITNLIVTKQAYLSSYVPFGRWYLPNDYANGATQTGVTEIYDKHRKVFSDAQMSDTITDTVEALMTPQKHISVTQATTGQWAVNDKFTINSDYGVVSGVIDSDTANATVVQSGTSTNQIYLNDVSKLAVNDTIEYVIAQNLQPYNQYTITAVDTTNKVITVNGTLNPYIGDFIVETTASTSSPSVTNASGGIAGTWSGLGTKSATFTITTAPTTNTDDLKVQYSVDFPAGKGIQYVPTNVLSSKVNGEDINDTGATSVKANFVGKVSGNTDLVPHTASYGSGGSLATPSASWSEFTSGYSQIATLDGVTSGETISTSGQIAQQMFKFNLIRAVEDKFGEIPGTTTADKVSWLTSNLTSMKCNWWGYGSSPSGNKATLTTWFTNASQWAVSGWSGFAQNTASSPSELSDYLYVSSDIGHVIDSNGFVYFLAYADASDGTTASTIYTDYVELELDLNVAETGYTVLQPANKFPVLSENLLSRNQAFPVDTEGFGATVLSAISMGTYGVKLSMSGNTSGSNSVVDIATGFTQSGYFTIYGEIYSDYEGQITLQARTDLAPNYVASALVINLVKGMNKFSFITNANSSVGNLNGLRFYWSDTAIIDFEIVKLKVEQGANPNPKWTEGRRKTTTLNFLGKVAGSTFENPSRKLYTATSTFGAPSTITAESGQGAYDNTAKQDGTLDLINTGTSGYYAQQLFEFDLSHFGLSLKELRNALRQLSVSWTGYGVGTQGEIATPSAPSMSTATTGGTVLAGTYYAKYTWVNANGQTIGSGEASVTTTGSTSTVTVTIPALPSGATSANIYMGTTAGAETLQGSTTSTTFTLTAPPTTTGASVPTTNTTGVTTNGAQEKWWNANTATWALRDNNSGSTPSTLADSETANPSYYVTNDQKVYVLVHSTYPAGTPSASNIYTDYVKLDVTLADYVDYKKTNIVKVRPQTKEVKLLFPAKSYRYVGGGAQEDVVEAWYQYVPYQGTGNTDSIVALTEPFLDMLSLTTGVANGLTDFVSQLPLNTQSLEYAPRYLSNTVNTSEMFMPVLSVFAEASRWRIIGQTLTLSANTEYQGRSDNLKLASSQARIWLTFFTTSELKTDNPNFTDNLLAVALLGEIDNELYLIVGTNVFHSSTDSVGAFYHANGQSSFDTFKVQGRPLVKGVN